MEVTVFPDVLTVSVPAFVVETVAVDKGTVQIGVMTGPLDPLLFNKARPILAPSTRTIKWLLRSKGFRPAPGGMATQPEVASTV